MKIPSLVAACAMLSLVSCANPDKNTGKNPDFDSVAAWSEFQRVIGQHYAYLNDVEFDAGALFKEFETRARQAWNQQEFVDIAQQLVRHFHDPHLNVGPYNSQDFSVSPTGSDIWGVYQDGLFVVEDVKGDSAADIAGIRPGDRIMTIDDMPVIGAIEKVFGTPFPALSAEQINHGLNVSLGGLRNQARTLELSRAGKTGRYRLAASYQAIDALKEGPPLSAKLLNEIGYIRFNNSLGNEDTVKAFEEAITALAQSKALIIDLRNTPSGGNTGVAEPILGHFITQKTAYPLYQVQQEGVPYRQAEMQTAYARPSRPYYDKPFVVLAGRWTGSMGEGMTIGLDALGAKNVIGAPMADLLGGIKTVNLAGSDAWISVGFERLFHVDGSFREDFVPHRLQIPADRGKDGTDPALSQALDYLAQEVL